jgi:hypothetical protein
MVGLQVLERPALLATPIAALKNLTMRGDVLAPLECPGQEDLALKLIDAGRLAGSGEQKELISARHDKLIMVQHNKLIMTRRNKLI